MMKKPSIACYCPFTQGLCFFLSVKILQIIIQAEHTLRNINITTEIGK